LLVRAPLTAFLLASLAGWNCCQAADPLKDDGGATKEDWASYGGTPLAWRYSSLDQINKSNVRRIAPAWVFQTGDYADGLQTTPIVIAGIMYISTASNWVIALDATNGKLLWEYRYVATNGPTEFNYGHTNRGVAVEDGRVFIGTNDNHAIALDQKTGRELWNVDLEPAKFCGCGVTGAPLVVRHNVIFGVTGGDSVHRGYLTALDTKTGRLAWRFYTIPGPGEKGHETWPGGSWKSGGGSTWLTGSYDAQLDLLYWGVGNASPDLNASSRKGANLYTDSIVALNPDTGKLQWYNQLIPQDVWDFDASFELILADIPVRGQKRKLLFQFGKSGYLWALDRTNGEFVGAWPFIEHSNWISGITETGQLVGRLEPPVGKETLVCPGAMGGKSWNHASFSPQTGMLYSTGVENCNMVTPEDQDPEGAEPGAMSFGGSFTMKPPPGDKFRGFVGAYDPATGKLVWKNNRTYYMLSSILTTAGGLVFCGDPQGNFLALDARTGKELWSFSTGGGHRGSPVSYSVNGRQFVATPSGWGSIIGGVFSSLWPEAPKPRSGSSIFAFTLPEKNQ
jgi:alcohol dehydrogenase (cytochrome c)